ncbi:MAG: AAA family ATPase [Ruminococcus sp.]|nr:AAA family ATPase [Ruminococcus sp.]
MNKKPLICILGCSGSGKSTICLELEQKFNLKQIISHITGNLRFDSGTGHYFLSEEVFNSLKGNHVAYMQIAGAEYGVTNEQINNEKYDLYIVDFTGLKKLRKSYKGKRKIISVYIECPLHDRYERLNKRYIKQFDTFKEANEKTLECIVHDAGEFHLAPGSCDYIIDNHTGNYGNALMKMINICMEHGIINREKILFYK